MNRFTPAVLAGLVVLVTATTASAFPKHKGGYWYGQPTPAAAVAPLSFQQVLGGLQFLHILVGDWQQQQQQGGGKPAPFTVTSDVVKSIDNSDATLKSAVDATNELLKKVRVSDPRATLKDKLKDDVVIVQPGTQTGPGTGKGPGTLPVPGENK
jgi:hypothetical protein